MRLNLVLIALLAFAAFAFVNQRDSRLKAEARAGLWEDRADSLAAFAQESQSALDELNLQEDALVTHLTIQRDSALDVADRARTARPRVIERVVMPAPQPEFAI